MISLINKSDDWPPNYRKAARTFPQIFCIPLFSEQADSRRPSNECVGFSIYRVRLHAAEVRIQRNSELLMSGVRDAHITNKHLKAVSSVGEHGAKDIGRATSYSLH